VARDAGGSGDGVEELGAPSFSTIYDTNVIALLIVLPALLAGGLVSVDAARRGRNWPIWAIVISFTGIFGVLVWLVVRRRTPVVANLSPRRVSGVVLASLLIVVLRVIVGTYTTAFLFQGARIEGSAMAPTLNDQDRLIVNKLAYESGDPRVGEIVMFYYPLNPNKVFVKRLIAQEGDQVRIVDGRVYRNNVPVDDSFVPSAYRSHDNWGPQVVPEGYYFVMGDHRNNSSDSRHWGFVPKKYITGRVALRWWPPSSARRF
jgi:signal peptidase I